jgi:hypothetical protein
VVDAAGQVRLRLRVPASILDMVRYGSEHPERICRHWWRTVEQRTERWVMARVPAGCEGLRIRLDPERLEVVLSYRLPRRRCG